jgi:hypothetical protein
VSELAGIEPTPPAPEEQGMPAFANWAGACGRKEIGKIMRKLMKVTVSDEKHREWMKASLSFHFSSSVFQEIMKHYSGSIMSYASATVTVPVTYHNLNVVVSFPSQSH